MPTHLTHTNSANTAKLSMNSTSKNNLFFSINRNLKYFSLFANIEKKISIPTGITLSTVELWSNFYNPTNELFVCLLQTSTFRASLSVTICFSISLMYVILSNHYQFLIFEYTIYSFCISQNNHYICQLLTRQDKTKQKIQ